MDVRKFTVDAVVPVTNIASASTAPVAPISGV